mgnify:CR=1 FL=1
MPKVEKKDTDADKNYSNINNFKSFGKYIDGCRTMRMGQ